MILPQNRKGLEVQTLITLIIVGVFLLVMLIAIFALWTDGNIFSGAGNICEKTGGLIRGCT